MGNAPADRSLALRHLPKWTDRLAIGAWLPLVLLVVIGVPVFGMNEIDTDEGLNLEVARRLADGHVLYRDIWYDQPPLYPWMLAGLVALTDALGLGDTVVPLVAGRMLSLLFGAGLLAALYAILRREVGTPAALAATLWLTLAYQYVRLSSASMPPLTAVSLAVVAVWAALRCADARAGRPAVALFAGAALAGSFLIKPIVWFAPLLAAGCIVLIRPLQQPPNTVPGVSLFAHKRRGARPEMRLLLLLAASFTFVLLVGVLLAGRGMLPLVFGAGWGHVTRDHFARQDISARTWYVVERSWPLLLAAGVGVLRLVYLVIQALQHRSSGPGGSLNRSSGGLALAWLVAAAASIAWHRPIWWHHYLLALVPLAWLAGFGAQLLLEVVGSWRDGLTRKVLAAAAITVIAWLTYYSLYTGEHLPRVRYEAKAGTLDPSALALLRAAPPGPVFADRLLYVVAADRAVPPWWALIGEKRLRSDPSIQRLGQSLEEAGVSAVLLARWKPDYLGPEFAAWLERHFQRVGDGDRVAVYYRKS